MLQRRIVEEPVSQLALWARRLALFSLVATVVSIIITRSGLMEIVPALATFAGALVFAVLGMLLALASLVAIWREGVDGLRSALTALAIGIALLAYPAYLGFLAYRLPAIVDVTTDFDDPPQFEIIARLRPRGANPVAYAGDAAADLQREAYPNVAPLIVTTTPQQTFDAALAVITKRRWSILDQQPPQAGRRDGHIEAVARTPIMGFREDVVLRVRADGDGARLDVRSASRYGRLDFGSNASRIQKLTDDIDVLLGTQAAEHKAPERTPPQRPGKSKPRKR
ncbi:MAG TPA: DUF1499 domain-containing protein [Xanthobacteraceae bacterium]|nr:DUF1499 domain-containing protein [Xanthobacteraceae bacterium]